jgi:hypothetical protein
LTRTSPACAGTASMRADAATVRSEMDFMPPF